MKIVRGKRRIVIIFKEVVIKIAIIKIVCATNIAIEWIRERRFWRNMCECNYEKSWTVHNSLFRGLFENWHEYRLYKDTRSLFLVPTYFSLLGIINIQKKQGELLDMKPINLWLQMVEISNEEVWEDEHHFVSPKNFCKTKGSLQMFDYGSRGCCRVIKKYGEKMRQGFDFAFKKN